MHSLLTMLRQKPVLDVYLVLSNRVDAMGTEVAARLLVPPTVRAVNMYSLLAMCQVIISVERTLISYVIAEDIR